MNLRRRIVVGVAAAAVVACSGADVTVPIGVPPAAPLTTDSIGYIARVVAGTRTRGTYEFRIIARYENVTGQPLYFEKCFPNSVLPVYDIGLGRGETGFPAYNALRA